MVHLALWCIQDNADARPSMRTVVEVLQGHLDLGSAPLYKSCVQKLLCAAIGGSGARADDKNSGDKVGLTAPVSRLSPNKKYKLSSVDLVDQRSKKAVDGKDPFFELVTLRNGGVFTKDQLESELENLVNCGMFQTVEMEGVTQADGTIKININFVESQWQAAKSMQCINVGRLAQTKQPDFNSMTEKQQQEYLGKQEEEYKKRRIRERIQKWYHDEGYACAQVVNFGNLNTNEIVCEVVEGDITDVQIMFQDKMGLPVEGNTQVPIIERELPSQLSSGKIFNIEAGKKALRNINNLSLFSNIEVNPRPDEEIEGGITVEVKLKELEQNTTEISTEWSIVPGNSRRPTLASIQPGGNVTFEHRNIKGLNHTLFCTVTSNNLFNPQDDLGFKMEYLDGLTDPRERTLKASCFNSHKVSAVSRFGRRAWYMGRSSLTEVIVNTVYLVQKFTRQSKLTYGFVMEEVTTRDAICTNGARVLPSGALSMDGPPTTHSDTGTDRVGFFQANLTHDNTKFVQWLEEHLPDLGAFFSVATDPLAVKLCMPMFVVASHHNVFLTLSTYTESRPYPEFLIHYLYFGQHMDTVVVLLFLFPMILMGMRYELPPDWYFRQLPGNDHRNYSVFMNTTEGFEIVKAGGKDIVSDNGNFSLASHDQGKYLLLHMNRSIYPLSIQFPLEDAASLVLQNSGNVLINFYNGSVRQSFDFPSEFFLPTQILKTGMRIMSNNYETLVIVQDEGLFWISPSEFYEGQFQHHQPYQAWRFNSTCEGSTSTFLQYTGSNLTLSNDCEQLSLTTSTESSTPLLPFLHFDSDGSITSYKYEGNQWIKDIQLTESSNQIKSWPGNPACKACSQYEICNADNGSCSCLKPDEHQRQQYRNYIVMKHKFSGIGYYRTEFMQPNRRNSSLDECTNACFAMNCSSCMSLIFNGNTKDCFFISYDIYGSFYKDDTTKNITLIIKTLKAHHQPKLYIITLTMTSTVIFLCFLAPDESWYFPTWVVNQVEKGNFLDVIDERVRASASENYQQAKKMVHLALWCIQDNADARPSMRTVVEVLQGHLDLGSAPLYKSCVQKLLCAAIGGSGARADDRNSGDKVGLTAPVSRLSPNKKYKLSGVDLVDQRSKKAVDGKDPFFELVTLRTGGVFTKDQLESELENLVNCGMFQTVEMEGVTQADGTIKININFVESQWQAAKSVRCINVGLLAQTKQPDFNSMTEKQQQEYLGKQEEEYKKRVRKARKCMLPRRIEQEISGWLSAESRVTARMLQRIRERIQKWYHDEGYACAQVVNFGNLNTNEIVCEVVEGDITDVQIMFQDKMGLPVEGNTQVPIIERQIEGGIIVEVKLKELEQKTAEISTEWRVPGNSGRPTLASIQPGCNVTFERRNIKSLNRTLICTVTSNNLFNPQDDLGFKMEYLDGLTDPRERTLKASRFNSRKVSEVFTGGPGLEDVPGIWKFTRQSKLTYGFVMEEVTTRDENSAICTNGARVLPSGAGRSPDYSQRHRD
ncbi:hypothetical protein SELMODRAFT_430784 [Selaginella moellendorffii]|uniref:Apple domain-containing protein n=1 Tax=Selaginella moellendorffii TaxID=88036 RepID=D8TAI2_SELML|nr:hypothetical protein SELMODRAFT_430784 [Selaginella moellendorffii]